VPVHLLLSRGPRLVGPRSRSGLQRDVAAEDASCNRAGRDSRWPCPLFGPARVHEGTPCRNGCPAGHAHCLGLPAGPGAHGAGGGGSGGLEYGDLWERAALQGCATLLWCPECWRGRSTESGPRRVRNSTGAAPGRAALRFARAAGAARLGPQTKHGRAHTHETWATCATGRPRCVCRSRADGALGVRGLKHRG
jgi:hypothetical protein